MKRKYVRLKEHNQKLLPSSLPDVQRNILRADARTLHINGIDTMSIKELALAIAKASYRKVGR